MNQLPIGMRYCPDCNGEGEVHTMLPNPDMTEISHVCEFPGCAEGKGLVPVEHAVWTEPLQLTQIRQWESGTLYPEHETFSFGHGFGTALVEAVEQLHALLSVHDDSVETPGVNFIVEWRNGVRGVVYSCSGFTTIDQATKYADDLPSFCRNVAVCRVVVRQTVVRP